MLGKVIIDKEGAQMHDNDNEVKLNGCSLPDQMIYYLFRDYHVFQNRSIRFFDVGSELDDPSVVIKNNNILIF